MASISNPGCLMIHQHSFLDQAVTCEKLQVSFLPLHQMTGQFNSHTLASCSLGNDQFMDIKWPPYLILGVFKSNILKPRCQECKFWEVGWEQDCTVLKCWYSYVAAGKYMTFDFLFSVIPTYEFWWIFMKISNVWEAKTASQPASYIISSLQTAMWYAMHYKPLRIWYLDENVAAAAHLVTFYTS